MPRSNPVKRVQPKNSSCKRKYKCVMCRKENTCPKSHQEHIDQCFGKKFISKHKRFEGGMWCKDCHRWSKNCGLKGHTIFFRKFK